MLVRTPGLGSSTDRSRVRVHNMNEPPALMESGWLSTGVSTLSPGSYAAPTASMYSQLQIERKT
jgi:hypothetical protein